MFSHLVRSEELRAFTQLVHFGCLQNLLQIDVQDLKELGSGFGVVEVLEVDLLSLTDQGSQIVIFFLEFKSTLDVERDLQWLLAPDHLALVSQVADFLLEIFFDR